MYAVPGAGVPAPFGLGWPYWILDTDYESYASVYSCASFGLTGLKYEYAWLFTRDPVPSDEAVSVTQGAPLQRRISLFAFENSDLRIIPWTLSKTKVKPI